MTDESVHQPGGDAAPLVSGRGAQIVDVEIRRAIRLQVGVAAYVAHDRTVLDGNEQGVARISDIGGEVVAVDGVVEHVWADIVEQGRVRGCDVVD